MIARIVIVAIGGILTGCNEVWDAQKNYACSAQQIEDMQPQIIACSANGWAKDYCYAVAVTGHCSKIGEAK